MGVTDERGPREFPAADLGRALEEAEPGPNERQARLAFRVSLGLVLLPVISLPLQWLLAVAVNRRREPGEGRRYGSYVIALAALDTLAYLCLALSMGGVIAELPARGAGSTVLIGVLLDGTDEGPGARVTSVADGSPAETSGVLIGDRILAIDGESIADSDALIEEISSGLPGELRELTIRRDDIEQVLSVSPDLFVAPEVEERGLFEVVEPSTEAEGSGGFGGLLWIVVSFAIAILLAARRAGGALLVAMLILLVQITWVAAGVVGQLGVELRVGGFTSGGMLIGMAAGSIVAAFASWIAMLVLRARGLLPAGGGAGVGRQLGAFFIGLLLVLAIWPRSGALSIGLAAIFEALGQSSVPFDTTEMLRSTGMPPVGIWMMVGVVVLLAPLYEELLFRGLFLPWLARGLGELGAIIASAIVFGVMHAHYGPFVLVPIGYGLALGWARVRSGGVLVPWLLHAVINTIASYPLWWPLVAGE